VYHVFHEMSHRSSTNVYDERCKIIWGDPGSWSPFPCHALFNWICQIKRGSTLKEEPSTDFGMLSNLMSKMLYAIFTKNYDCIKVLIQESKMAGFNLKTMSIISVIQQCLQKKPGSSANNIMVILPPLRAVTYGIHSDSYIGLILSLDKKFSWMDGTPVTYEAWAPSEPNFTNEDEHCVVMYYDSGNDQKSFICERYNSSVRTTAAPTLPATPKGCSESWLWFNDKCFQVFGFREEKKKNWSAARDHCRNLGGNLASIPNKAVQVNLKSAAGDTWIGFSDKNWDGRFLWTDGSGVYFTNWAKGSPRSNNGDCVFMLRKPERLAGYWRVGACSSKRSYICQKNTGPEPYSETTVPSSHYISYENSSYSTVSPKMTWEEARKKCESENSKLATIVDTYAESFIWLQVFKYKEPVWIGLSSKENDARYKWVSNWRLTYTNWAAGEPLHKTACVYLDTNGVVPTEIPQLPGKCQTSKNSRISWIPFRGHCYKVYVFMKSWPAAALMCTQIVTFVNWNEPDLKSLQFDNEEDNVFSEKCIYMSSNSGKWFMGHCHYFELRPFICKRSKIIEESTVKPTTIPVQKEVAPLSVHGTAVRVIIPIIFIVIGAGIAAYIFYRRRNTSQISAGFDHSLYSHNVVILHKDSQPLVDNKELN
ncbi:hypothetical protein E2320_001758, partial [Naja naja]